MTPRERLTAEPSDLTARAPVVPYYEHWRQLNQKTKPGDLNDILLDAEMGRMLMQCEFFEDALDRDLVLSGAFTTRKMAVTKNEYEFVEREGTGRKGRRQADFMRDVTNNLSLDALRNSYEADVLDFNALLWDSLDSVPMGFSLPLLTWQQDSTEWRIVEARHTNQKFVMYGYLGAMPWNPYEIRIRTYDPHNPQDEKQNQLVYGVPLPRYRYLYSIYRGYSGYPTRAALLRGCAWYYLLKWYGFEGAAIYTDLYGIPLRVGRYDAHSSTVQNDINILKRAVKGLGRDAWAVIEKSMDIEFKEPAGKAAGLIHREFIEMCDTQMLIGILGQSGTTISVAGKLGEEKEKGDVRDDIMEADARALQSTIQYRYVTPLALFNDGAVLVDFKIHSEKTEDQNSKADRYAKLSTFMPIPLSHLHETFGIPEPMDGEATTIVPGRMADAPNAFRAVGKTGGRRADRHARIKSASDNLTRLIDGAIHDAQKIYVSYIDGIDDFANETRLKSALKKNRSTFETSLEQLLSTVLTSAYALANEALGIEPKRVVGKTYPTVIGGGKYKFSLTNSKALDFIRFQTFAIKAIESEKITADIEKYVKDNVLKAMDDGMTHIEFREAVLEGIGAGNIKPYHIDTIFRTNIATAHSASKLYALAENKAFFPTWEFMAILDSDTTEECEALNGRVFAQDDTAYWPPLHFNCRSEASPIDQLEMRDAAYTITDSSEVEIAETDTNFTNNAVENFTAWVNNMVSEYPDAKSSIDEYE